MASKDGPPTVEHDSASSRSALSPTRRERKRDRISQQGTRARTKAYIEHLENTTARLTEALGGNSAAVSEQMAQRYGEIEGLKGVIARIAKIANGAMGFTYASTEPDIQNRSSKDISHSSLHGMARASPAATVPAGYCGCFAPETFPPVPHTTQETLKKIYPTINLKCSNKDRDYFGALNHALVTIESNHARHLFSGPHVDDDTSIRAVLHGWDAARAKNPFDVGWQLLQILDEGLFFRSGSVERMAILRIMRAMLMTKINSHLPPDRKPPSFMNPSPLQAQVSHPRLIDYFVWPEVRDYLIISGISYAPESLAAQFAVDIGFKWPFTLRDTCTYQPSTGVYAFSKHFTEACESLESWYFKSPIMSLHLPLSPDKSATGLEDDWTGTLPRSCNLPSETFQQADSWDGAWEGIMPTENL